MQKQISLILLLVCVANSAAAQIKVREKEQGEAARRKAEIAQQKAQAVDLLKGVVEGCVEIPELQTRVSVLTSALDLLWKHDEDYARERFIKFAAALSDKFSSDSTDRNERTEIRAAHAVLLKAFARHDAQAAEQLLERFQKVLDQVVKGNAVSPNERLSVAQAGLESDVSQSVALAGKVLDSGVPGSFPSYMNELEQRDPVAAASLFRKAISNLAGGRVYTPIHATVLSAYVFREAQVSVPVPNGGRDGAPLEFGTFAMALSPANRSLDRELVAAYLSAAGVYLNSEAFGLERNTSPDASHVGFCFFLVKKLRAYADNLGFNPGQEWTVLDAKYVLLTERAKLTSTAVAGLSMVAQRIVNENTVFRFDAGDSAFAEAGRTRDPAERAEKLATGIRQMIDDGKYSEAVQKIDELQDAKSQDQLNAYRSFRMAQAATKKLDWDAFNAHVSRVSDPQLRSYLTLSAALAANNSGKKETSSEFLTAAIALLSKIDDFNSRAAVLMTVAGVLYSGVDVQLGAQVLSEGAKAINRAERYDGGVYRVTLEAPKYKELLPLPGSDLGHCFEQVAKQDWVGAVAVANGIESKALRSQAYIAASRNVLK
jgi:hypothetical protein